MFMITIAVVLPMIFVNMLEEINGKSASKFFICAYELGT